MPAAEAEGVARDERSSYEFAFHVLPTVAEGEVPAVVEKIKAHITKAGGDIFGEESPERIDLVYPVVKQIEGKNRKFTSSYFGWIRFRLEGSLLESMREELDAESSVLRSLMIKLTKIEEAHPFRFHEQRKSLKMVETIDEDAELLKTVKTETEEVVEVSEVALDESLEKITEEKEEVKA